MNTLPWGWIGTGFALWSAAIAYLVRDTDGAAAAVVLALVMCPRVPINKDVRAICSAVFIVLNVIFLMRSMFRLP